MPSDRAQKLRRLIRATRVMQLQEMADLAQLHAAAGEIADGAASAESYLNESSIDGNFLFELGIARVDKMRRELVEIKARLDVQIEKATSIMTKTKGAENLLQAERSSFEKSLTVAALDEIIDMATIRKSSLG